MIRYLLIMVTSGFFRTMSFVKKPIRNILFLDIDDTLLRAGNVNIFYRKGNVFKKYSSQEYAKLIVNDEDKKYFDFSEMYIPEKIIKTIGESKPIKRSLEIIDEFIKNGFEIGIITARGGEDTIRQIMPKWLNNHLQYSFKLNQSQIFAVNDEYKKYRGNTDQEKKLNILKYYATEGVYQKVYFMDDNKNTINMIREYNKELKPKEKIKLIHVDWI